MIIRSTAGLSGTQALILAGGRGERLLPLTAFRPKPAVPFGGVFRILDFTLSNCLNSNLGRVAVLTQYRQDALHRYIRETWSEIWNERETTLSPLLCLPPASGKRYRGTAHAVFENLPVIESQTQNVIILSGDHVYQMDYRELLAEHMERNADVTIATVEHPVKDASLYGVVEVDTDFRLTGFQEKPAEPPAMPSRPLMALISMGVYVFKRDVLIRTLIENCHHSFGYDFGRHIIPSLIGSARVYAHDFRHDETDSPRYWRDIGTIDSYYEANLDLVRPNAPFNPYVADWRSRSGLRSENSASVSCTARVSQSVLSAGVRAEQDASIEDSVLMPGVRVGRGARIRRAIIEEGIQIPADFSVGWDLEHDRLGHTISPTGVVVVSETPKTNKPVRIYPVQNQRAAGFPPAASCGNIA